MDGRFIFELYCIVTKAGNKGKLPFSSFPTAKTGDNLNFRSLI